MDDDPSGGEMDRGDVVSATNEKRISEVRPSSDIKPEQSRTKRAL